ncbi:MAG TPA: tRNA (5-methylaminomethyl-2-thiouridine)(34)-methyltransferase MnmD [Trueperaceae bacterium]
MVGPLTTLDGSLTLASERYGETYRSRRGALTEARHVFLGASGVAKLLLERGRAAVLEVGFGTGLNFLVTACAAARAGAALRYVSVERDPLPAAVVTELRYGELLAPCAVPASLNAWLAGLGGRPSAGSHGFSAGRVELELVVGDAAEVAPSLPTGAFDAVYLDPFSPRANPEAWEEELLALLVRALRPGGRLVSYSVSGEVRRRLAAAGAFVSKAPGPPGGKRESLVAERPS